MEEPDKKFIDLYIKLGNLQGVNDIMSRIFAMLYISPTDVAMDDLAKQTGYSLASISNNIKMLEAFGFIRRIRKPGTKKIFLYLEKDMKKLMKETLIKKQQVVINTIKAEMPQILEDYRKKAKKNIEKKKLNILEDYYDGILAFEKVIKKMIKEINKI
jgi:DNA-binding transcriptional regulator GbsR (MarR family)